MIHRVSICIALLCLTLISCTRSDSLPGETDSYNEIFSKSITYLEDTENSISIDQILSNSYRFEPVYPINDENSFTYLHTYWVHIPAKIIPGDRLPLGLKIPIQNHIVDVYYISKNSIKTVRTGFFVNGDVNDEIIPVSNIVNLSDPGIKDIYVQIKNINDEPPSVQLEVVDLRASFRKFKMASLFDSFLLGMMILIILYGFFLYVVNRDKLYLTYGLYVLFLSFWYFTCFEFGYQLILKLPRILYHYTDTPGLIAFILYIQFMRYFIESPKNLPGWDRILRIQQVALLAVSIIFPLFMFFTNRIVLGYYWLASFIIVMDIFIFVLIIRLLRSNIRFSNLMALGSFFAISGLLILAVYAIVFNNYTYVSQKFGTLLELIVFTYGISLRYRAIEMQKRQYQQQLIEQLQVNTKIQEEANKELTRKVDERTSEIRRKNQLLQQQKEEVETQRDEIETQRDEIEAQRDEIESQRDEVEAQRDEIKSQRDLVVTQKDEIIDSINYAEKIQAAILPPEKYFHEILNDVFIYFKPRDIVSGDFFWIKHVNQYVILAAADCTGHGVPGAFMSLLGISYLNEIVQRREITQANQVLNELRKQIRNSLRQHGKAEESKDGIDMALCVIDEKKNTLQYSGANNPLYLIKYRTGAPELTEYKADRMPLGYYQGSFRSFTNKEIQLEYGDVFYLFSDGFIDQKGGRDNKKFMSKNFKNLLLDIHQEPMQEQKNILDKTISGWMGDNSQIDDILVIGVRV